MKRKRKTKPRLSKIAEQTLVCLLTPIALSLILTAFAASSLDTYSLARMHSLFCDQLEHIMMSLLIAVGGSLLLDAELKRRM